MPNQDLVASICKEFQNSTNKQKMQLEHEQKSWIHISLKKIYRLKNKYMDRFSISLNIR